ncbi:sodium:solute symporter family protein [Kocuria turfanensis]|uniref:Sodium:solute symporter n=1 Tax=Kocuria turfanensis TaxID=388357 RepID=A0A512IH86_9MICC|nr:sodium:solute symporter family protein [Kocuria turfanensis]GEO97061.1 sodium:solute symporter [Kocuria turfanensis]
MIILGVGTTVLAVLVIGVLVARKVDGDSTNYLVAGRQLGMPLVAVSLTAAAVDSNATVGNTDLTSGYGFWAGASLALGLAVCLLLAGLFLAKPMNRMRLLTLGDFFRIRYGRRTETLASLIMIFAFTFLLAGNLVACGFLLEYFAHVPYAAGVVVASALVLSYTLAGGLFSDAYTAVLQTVITVVAAVALIVWVALTYGIVVPEGMGPFDLEQLTSSEAGAPVNWATLVALGIGDLVAIDFMQRIFGAKSPRVAQRSCFLAAGTTAVIGTIFALVALTASSVLGLSAADGPILYALLGEYAPPLLAVLVLSGIVAASFSTASGAILATSAVTVRNVFNVRRTEISGAHDPLLRWTRLAMLPVVLIGILLAVRVSQTGILLTLAFDLMLASLSASFILGAFWKRPGARAALAAAGVGLTSRLVFLALTPTIYGAPNELFHLESTLVTSAFDGWATLLAGALGWLTYVLVGLTAARPQAETDTQRLELYRLYREQTPSGFTPRVRAGAAAERAAAPDVEPAVDPQVPARV